jgi:hypothetical protein
LRNDTCDQNPNLCSPSPGGGGPADVWINLRDDIANRPASERDRLAAAVWMQQDWAAMKSFSPSSQNCLNDLGKFGLTPQSVQALAGSTPLMSYNIATHQGGFAPNFFIQGADFTAVRNSQSGQTLLVYNPSNFWQSSSSEMSGTLLHEILHLSSNGNYRLTDLQIATRLGVQNQLKFDSHGNVTDDSAISKKLATDCFPTNGGK